ncbi:MAG: hypothetical protein JNJ99_14325, partial [Crocinitomicaceae bacterium]|nr:hypothetical protein [Crocinitomicaceae bacterium]
MAKYLNKYRIESSRLKGFDYNSNGSYFITICTKNRFPYFGNIADGKMHLTEIGKLAEQFWKSIPDHFSHATLGEFIIMPDHMHGIITLNATGVQTTQCVVSAETKAEAKAESTAGTTESIKNQKMAAISPKPGSISVIIGSYKSVVSKNAHKISADFNWQERFHDRI